jgi:acetylornithine/succinyldiaminopimelate/putrescine aminotransferase
MGNEHFKQAYRPLLPNIKFIHYGSWIDIEQITNKTACVILETIQGEAGVRTACKEYFKLLREKCAKTGTLLVLDEIQCGVGRTGTMWAFEELEIIPDILLLAKGLGGGMPIGAFISSQEIFSVFRNNPILGHITTFGGHPVNCAAALATLQVVENEKLTEKVKTKSALFKKHLNHAKIKEIRGNGLMLAVEFESFSILKKIIDKAIENGVITDWFLHCDNSMRIAPPLTITEQEIIQACEIINNSI